MTAKTAQQKEEIATVIVDEVHNRSAQSDYVCLTLAAMQKTPDLRLVLMSATGDRQLVEEMPEVGHFLSKVGHEGSNRSMVFSNKFLDLLKLTSSVRSLGEPFISDGHMGTHPFTMSWSEF